MAQEDRTDPSVGRSMVRERSTSGHVAMPLPTEVREGCSGLVGKACAHPPCCFFCKTASRQQQRADLFARDLTLAPTLLRLAQAIRPVPTTPPPTSHYRIPPLPVPAPLLPCAVVLLPPSVACVALLVWREDGGTVMGQASQREQLSCSAWLSSSSLRFLCGFRTLNGVLAQFALSRILRSVHRHASVPCCHLSVPRRR